MLSNITRRIAVSGLKPPVQQRFSAVVAGPPLNHVPKGVSFFFMEILIQYYLALYFFTGKNGFSIYYVGIPFRNSWLGIIKS